MLFKKNVLGFLFSLIKIKYGSLTGYRPRHHILGKMSSNADLKLLVEKLEGPDDWAKWKWHINMVFQAHALVDIINGTRKCSERGTTSESKIAVQKWYQDDAKAASIIAIALNSVTAELVLTCTNAFEIWEKL